MKEVKEKRIARLPVDDGSCDDDYCSICGDDNIVLVIEGRTNCNYCGNQINLCSSCCGIMKREINSINDGLDIVVK